jgi:hypothetical protein
VLGVNGDWDLFCPAAGGARNVELFGVSDGSVAFLIVHKVAQQLDWRTWISCLLLDGPLV